MFQYHEKKSAGLRQASSSAKPAVQRRSTHLVDNRSQAVIQRNIKMKGQGVWYRTKGSADDLVAEVDAVVQRNKGGETLEDIARLQASITSREKDNNGRPDAKHQYRIDKEKEQLVTLQDLRDKQLEENAQKAAELREAKKPDEDGWVTVTRRRR